MTKIPLHKRHVLEPTVAHCQSIVARDYVALPIRQYYNWFLIKYGDELNGGLLLENQRGCYYHLLQYDIWCQRFLKENKA